MSQRLGRTTVGLLRNSDQVQTHVSGLTGWLAGWLRASTHVQSTSIRIRFTVQFTSARQSSVEVFLRLFSFFFPFFFTQYNISLSLSLFFTYRYSDQFFSSPSHLRPSFLLCFFFSFHFSLSYPDSCILCFLSFSIFLRIFLLLSSFFFHVYHLLSLLSFFVSLFTMISHDGFPRSISFPRLLSFLELSFCFFAGFSCLFSSFFTLNFDSIVLFFFVK